MVPTERERHLCDLVGDSVRRDRERCEGVSPRWAARDGDQKKRLNAPIVSSTTSMIMAAR